MAVVHALLIVIYSTIRNGTVYSDLGANYLDEQHRKSVVNRAVHRIEILGYRVILEAA